VERAQKPPERPRERPTRLVVESGPVRRHTAKEPIARVRPGMELAGLTHPGGNGYVDRHPRRDDGQNPSLDLHEPPTHLALRKPEDPLTADEIRDVVEAFSVALEGRASELRRDSVDERARQALVDRAFRAPDRVH
jgi:hypothetical protein